MLKEIRSVLLWLLLAAGILFLPFCLVLLQDLYPGTSYANHLSSVVHLLATGLFLVLTPLPAQAVKATVPEEHKDQLRYALRSGVLPLASIFSDWSNELAWRRRAHSLALRVLPAGTVVAILLDVYGILLNPADHQIFLCCAAAAIAFGVAAIAFSAVRLRNIFVLEHKLKHQMRLLEAHPWST